MGSDNCIGLCTQASMAGNKGKQKARSFKRPKSFQAPPIVLGMGPNGGIHDAEPTRNVKEMCFTIYDWFTVKLPEVPTAGNLPDFVYSYGLEESQNFLGQVTDSVAADQGRGVTKNRIKSVSLDILSPEGTVEVGVSGGNLTKKIALPLVVSAVPVPTAEQATAASPGPNALIGQNTTVVHPDVRRALVRLGLYNSVDGAILFSPSSGPVTLDFRIAIEIAAPIGLTPTPLRFSGLVKNFAGEANNEVVAGRSDRTPVQYQIHGVQNLI